MTATEATIWVYGEGATSFSVRPEANPPPALADGRTR